MKNSTIKQVAFFCVLFLGLAVVANADTINLISSGGTTGLFDFTAYINRTINYNNTGYDRLDLDVSALTGPAVGTGIVDMGGTFTCPGSKGYTLVSDAAVANWNNDNGPPNNDWINWSTSASPAPPTTAEGYSGAPLSTISFPSFVANTTGPPPITNYSRVLGTGTAEEFSSFTGTWFGTSPLTSSIRLARLYVPTGWAPANGAEIFDGSIGFTYGGGTTENSNLIVAPEPATLVLLASALVGLAAYAWRKRK
jgi:hypothetical protein